MIPWWNAILGENEIQGVRRAILDRNISQGSLTQQFETATARALKTPHAVATTSGSMALFMALLVHDIGPGDEVLIPARTFVATAHAVLLTGAETVLVETLSHIPIMNVDRIEEHITPRTRAILPVHLNGRGVDMNRLNAIAERYGLFVIEDAAQAMFSKNREGFLGTHSHVGCFSLGMSKMIPTGQGGMLVTGSKKKSQALKMLRNHGVKDTFSSAYQQFGFNFKYTDLQAAIGLCQLAGVQTKINHLNKIYHRYLEGLSSLYPIQLIPVRTEEGEVPLYPEALCPERDDLIRYLASQNIQARPFSPDMGASPHIRGDRPKPAPSVFQKEGLFLPGGPDQPLQNIDRVLETLKLYHRKKFNEKN